MPCDILSIPPSLALQLRVRTPPALWDKPKELLPCFLSLTLNPSRQIQLSGFPLLQAIPAPAPAPKPSSDFKGSVSFPSEPGALGVTHKCTLLHTPVHNLPAATPCPPRPPSGAEAKPREKCTVQRRRWSPFFTFFQGPSTSRCSDAKGIWGSFSILRLLNCLSWESN